MFEYFQIPFPFTYKELIPLCKVSDPIFRITMLILSLACIQVDTCYERINQPLPLNLLFITNICACGYGRRPIFL